MESECSLNKKRPTAQSARINTKHFSLNYIIANLINCLTKKEYVFSFRIAKHDRQSLMAL